VPSLGYVVKAKGRRIVFASDQSAFSAGFELALKDLSPDLLFAHHVIPEGEGQPRLLLSHKLISAMNMILRTSSILLATFGLRRRSQWAGDDA